jgi:hypothetical protein
LQSQRDKPGKIEKGMEKEEPKQKGGRKEGGKM